ncbi:polyprenol phosphomannose-dependent alpha 1,6 mannosyltransferase MptB [Streptomyces californicus]|uniref:polyprenol phosphomannose-dependent alpha 1,6 mannosyltransferase MptB n=1 Tax=Streptomyces californicus TaxID=67351 RepID=UPI003679BC40
MWALSAVGYRRLGAAGSLAVVIGGWFAGKLPVHDPWGLWVDHGSAAKAVGAVIAYIGLTVLVVAWWQYGRTAATVRDTLVTLAWWTAPFLIAPPLYSADVYSYIAQGSMVVEGHDVYTVGPSALDPGGIGGDAAASVGHHWRDTPAPYGPLFLLLSAAVAKATGGTIVPAVLGLRLVALASLVLIVWSLRRLAAEHGHSESRALWLGALNPLLLMHVIGGIHNDGLMIGLMLAGFVLALRGRWIVGSALIGLAMMVKSPAAVALLFIGVLVHAAATGPAWRRWAKGLLAPGLVACAVAGGATLISGTGFGWLHTQGVAANIHTALSVTSDIGLGLGQLAHLLLDVDADSVKSAVQTLGLAVAIGLILVLARRAMRGAVTPAHALGLSLLLLVALSPMVQPWYLLWGMAVAAATGRYGRLSAVLIVLSAALVYETHPMGATPPYGFVLAGLAVLLGTFAIRRAPVVPPGTLPPGPRGPVDPAADQGVSSASPERTPTARSTP